MSFCCSHPKDVSEPGAPKQAFTPGTKTQEGSPSDTTNLPVKPLKRTLSRFVFNLVHQDDNVFYRKMYYSEDVNRDYETLLRRIKKPIFPMIILFDSDLKMMAVSQSLLKLTHFAADDLLGQPASKLIPALKSEGDQKESIAMKVEMMMKDIGQKELTALSVTNHLLLMKKSQFFVAVLDSAADFKNQCPQYIQELT